VILLAEATSAAPIEEEEEEEQQERHLTNMILKVIQIEESGLFL
jgi:hypothetical protein